MFLEPLNDPNVRQAEGGAALQHQADLLSVGGRCLVLRDSRIIGQSKNADAEN